MKIISPFLKLGLGGGTIYFVAKQGVFSDSQKEALEGSKKVYQLMPDVQKYIDQLPTGISKTDAISYWNLGVKVTISALSTLPTDSRELFSKGMHYLKEEVQNQMKNVEKK